MRSWPIWNEVITRDYASSKSYGARRDSSIAVCVGTSASNSEVLVEHTVDTYADGDYTVFRFIVDLLDGSGPRILKKKWMHTKSRAWFDTDPTSVRILSIDAWRDGEGGA